MELKQSLKQTQKLAMTPRMQQAIELLQLSRIEIADWVNQELQENPALEERSDNLEESLSEPANSVTPPQDVATGSREPVSGDASGVSWEDFITAAPRDASHRSWSGEERLASEQVEKGFQDLGEHINWQLQVANVRTEVKRAAQWIIGSLDEKGWLSISLDELAERSGCSVQELQDGLTVVQKCDPVGVGARDLCECLNLQLDSRNDSNALVRALVNSHLDDLKRKDFRKIAKDEKVSLVEVEEAYQVLSLLEPCPGRPFGADDSVYITPEILILKVDDEYEILLNEEGIPGLRVNREFSRLLRSGKQDLSKETKKYLQEKVSAASWLISSLNQRQETIRKVMWSIISYQRKFFDEGIGGLRPLKLQDVAMDIGMAESTVSRATAGKYVDTPHGVFSLKYFFISGVSDREGNEVSSENVKERIKKIIGEEDSARPLSDQRIVEELEGLDIKIARRTVTKYRESMNILSSTQRRGIR